MISVPITTVTPLQVVRKSNELIESRYRLNIWEQRLILLLLVNISPKDEDFKRYSIRVADFAEMWHLEADNSLYEKVQNVADSLVGRTLQISKDSNISKTVSWLAYVEYVRGSGVIELEFHSSLKPYLLQLKKYYTEYQLGHVINFKNHYAIRIYELLKMETFKAVDRSFSKHFQYDNLRTLLDINEKEYRLFGDFKKRIIVPSVKEISANTDLNIEEIIYGKTGRKITDITFQVKVRSAEEVQTLQLDMAEAPKIKSEHSVINKLVELGFALNMARRYKSKYGVIRIERNIAYTLAKQQEGLVKDVPAYLNKAISEDMGGVWDTQRKHEASNKHKQNQLNNEREAKADQAHMEKLAAMAGVPLDSLLKGEIKCLLVIQHLIQFLLNVWLYRIQTNTLHAASFLIFRQIFQFQKHIFRQT